MKKILQISCIILVLGILCFSNIDSSLANNYSTIKVYAKSNNNLKGNKTKPYHLEPAKSTLSGYLTTRLFYGQPGYGENPKTDAKEYPFILKLDQKIQIEDENKKVTSGISEIQVVPMNDSYKIVQECLKKHIKVKIDGSLFSAFTGHHHTAFLITVDKISKLK